MAFVLALLGLAFLILDQFVFLPTFIGAITVGILLFLLYTRRRHELVSIIFGLMGTILCQITLLLFPEEFHFVDLLWILVITLYTFFMLGRVWGVVIFAANTVGVVVFVLFILNYSLDILPPLNQGEIWGLAINIAICSLLIGYLIFQFLYVIRLAENDFRQANLELKEQNETIAMQHQEKTVMLREIHHRVKNNLQVITSLLRLQSEEIEDPHSKEKFNEAIHRVISMSMIHEKMYQSEHLSRINLKGYIQSLCEELIQSYNIQKPIALQVNCEIDKINPKSLVPIALIFNELISNSLKHAFSASDSGEIEVRILDTSESQDTIQMHYCDNGTWKESSRLNSFGLELIASLCEQLGSTMEVSTAPKTFYQFRFDPENLMGDA